MRKAPKKSYQELFKFMWVRKPIDRQHLELYFHVDDLILLSEFDDVTSALTTTCALITVSPCPGWTLLLKH